MKPFTFVLLVLFALLSLSGGRIEAKKVKINHRQAPKVKAPKSINDLTCFPEEENGGPSGLIRAFVSKAVSIPYIGDNLVFAYEIMQEVETISKKTSPDSTNKCMEQYISRTINKAIADKVRDAMSTQQRVYLEQLHQFKSWVSDKDFNVKEEKKRQEAYYLFREMWSPLIQLKAWYTTCTAKQLELNLCHVNDISNHAQFFVDFSVFASTQFLPYHLTGYLQFYTFNGVDNTTMQEARSDISKKITEYFAGQKGLYQTYNTMYSKAVDYRVEAVQSRYQKHEWTAWDWGALETLWHQKIVYEIKDDSFHHLNMKLECSGVYNWGHDGCPGWNEDKFERVNRNIKERARRDSVISLYLASGGMNWQVLVPEYSQYYRLTNVTKEVMLKPFSNHMEGIEVENPIMEDFSQPPRGVKPGSYKITRMEIWHNDEWVNGLKIHYNNGYIQEWGSQGDRHSILDNLISNPIVALSHAAQKEGPGKGDFVGYMRGFKVKRQNEQDRWSSYGDYDGRRNEVFHLHDDYSFPGANGKVWLCGLTTHGSAAWSVQRIQGMAPHWCYEEAVVVEKACPKVPGFEAHTGRDIPGGDISCKRAEDVHQAGVSDAYVKYVLDLAQQCQRSRLCNAISFSMQPGQVKSCLKTQKHVPDSNHVPNSCYYRKL